RTRVALVLVLEHASEPQASRGGPAPTPGARHRRPGGGAARTCQGLMRVRYGIVLVAALIPPAVGRAEVRRWSTSWPPFACGAAAPLRPRKEALNSWPVWVRPWPST